MAGDNTQTEQLSQSDLQNVQQELQQKGFYKNAQVDGKWGPHTRRAVQSFQHAKGLPASGHLDQQTLAALGVNKQGGQAISQGVWPRRTPSLRNASCLTPPIALEPAPFGGVGG
jgi:peptidoglycan hydrolase-like protein with peptidoglycan-binding domain